jgi:cytoskeletal protein CcmA (bactofilin family)
MFSKPNSAPPQSARREPPPLPPEILGTTPQTPRKAASLIASDLTLEGNISGGGELQIDGAVKGDVRVERVAIGDGGQVEGGIFAEAVEVRGRVTGTITAKQVRLYGACHVDGDITHEQLAIETGAFFEGRSLRLQRPLAHTAIAPATPARDVGKIQSDGTSESA